LTGFQKYSHIKFHENPSSDSRVVPCGRTGGRTDGQTDITKLIVAFRNFAKSPKIDQSKVLEKAVNIYQTALLYNSQDDIFRLPRKYQILYIYNILLSPTRLPSNYHKLNLATASNKRDDLFTKY